MDLTPNIGLGKPLVGENYDVGVFNGNADITDLEIKQLKDRVAAYDAALELVPWTDYPAVISKSADLFSVAAPTTSIQTARYCRIGKIVYATGSGTIGATAVVDACVSLPQGAGLTPHHRVLEFGTLLVTKGDGTAPDDQTGTARMNVDLKRVVVHSDTSGFRDAPANSNIYWNVWYEVV